MGCTHAKTRSASQHNHHAHPHQRHRQELLEHTMQSKKITEHFDTNSSLHTFLLGEGQSMVMGGAPEAEILSDAVVPTRVSRLPAIAKSPERVEPPLLEEKMYGKQEESHKTVTCDADANCSKRYYNSLPHTESEDIASLCVSSTSVLSSHVFVNWHTSVIDSFKTPAMMHEFLSMTLSASSTVTPQIPFGVSRLIEGPSIGYGIDQMVEPKSGGTVWRSTRLREGGGCSNTNDFGVLGPSSKEEFIPFPRTDSCNKSSSRSVSTESNVNDTTNRPKTFSHWRTPSVKKTLTGVAAISASSSRTTGAASVRKSLDGKAGNRRSSELCVKVSSSTDEDYVSVSNSSILAKHQPPPPPALLVPPIPGFANAIRLVRLKK